MTHLEQSLNCNCCIPHLWTIRALQVTSHVILNKICNFAVHNIHQLENNFLITQYVYNSCQLFVLWVSVDTGWCTMMNKCPTHCRVNSEDEIQDIQKKNIKMLNCSSTMLLRLLMPSEFFCNWPLLLGLIKIRLWLIQVNWWNRNYYRYDAFHVGQLRITSKYWGNQKQHSNRYKVEHTVIFNPSFPSLQQQHKHMTNNFISISTCNTSYYSHITCSTDSHKLQPTNLL